MRGQRIVVSACRRARAAGVRVGMTAAHATAILPVPPRLADHEPVADAEALRRLARWAVRFTPRVAVDGADGLVLDVAGSARLFGGLLPLARQVRLALGQLRLTARVAIAPTAALAWGLARYGDEGVCGVSPDVGRRSGSSGSAALALHMPGRTGASAPASRDLEPARDDRDAELALCGLPIAALRVEGDVVAQLAEVGVDRVGQLLDLPRLEIARRFGDDVLLRLDQCRGEAPEPIAWLPFEEPAHVDVRFAGPATQVEAISQTAESLVRQLADELARRESAARRIVLEIEKLDGDLRPTFASLPIALSHPTRDARHLWAVLRPGVERLDLGRGVDAMGLRATSVSRLPHGQSRLDGERDATRDEHDVGRLVDLLQGRLGRGRVLRIDPSPGHVPEAAYRRVPASEPLRRGEPFAIAGDRPTTLFDAPEPCDVTMLNPEGPLVTLRWRGTSRRVLTTVGPERIGRRWWMFALSRQSLAVRDYYKLQDETGLWLWAFRAMPARSWFVHGVWS